MSEQYQPLYSAREKSPINFMLILGLGAAVADFVLSGGVGGLFIIGIGVAIYAWFTTPTNYSLYNDRLLIFYGRPRVRHILFDNIEGVDNLVVPLSGPRLRVREFRGRGAWLTPRDPETFMEQFRIALDAFRGTTPSGPEEPGFVPYQMEGELAGTSDEGVESQPEELLEGGLDETESPESAMPEQEDPWGRRE